MDLLFAVSFVRFFSEYSSYKEIYVVFACRIAIGIEVTVRIVAAGEYSKANARNIIIVVRACLRSSQGTIFA